MGTTIAVANQKGGVGKTVTVLNLGAALQETSQHVLLVDMDPQASLTLALGAEDSEFYTDQLLEAGKPGTAALPLAPRRHGEGKGISGGAQAVLPGWEGLALMPSRFKLADINRQLAATPDGQQRLRRALEEIKEQYDYVLIDCPPSLGPLTINALLAADWMLIPMQCDYLALQGVTLVIKAVQAIQQQANGEVEVLGIVPTMYNSRTVHSAEVVEAAREHLGKLVLNTTIRYSAWAKKSPVAHQSVLTYAGHAAIAQDYRNLAEEVISHVKQGTSRPAV